MKFAQMLIVRIAFCNKRRMSEVDELTVTDFEKKRYLGETLEAIQRLLIHLNIQKEPF